MPQIDASFPHCPGLGGAVLWLRICSGLSHTVVSEQLGKSGPNLIYRLERNGGLPLEARKLWPHLERVKLLAEVLHLGEEETEQLITIFKCEKLQKAGFSPECRNGCQARKIIEEVMYRRACRGNG